MISSLHSADRSGIGLYDALDLAMLAPDVNKWNAKSRFELAQTEGCPIKARSHAGAHLWSVNTEGPGNRDAEPGERLMT